MTRRTFVIQKHTPYSDLAFGLPVKGYVLINHAIWEIESIDIHPDEYWYTLVSVNPHHLPADALVVELPKPTSERGNAKRGPATTA